MLTLLLVVLAAPKNNPPPAATLPTRAAVFVIAKDANEASAGKTETKLIKALDEAKVNVVDLDSLYPPAAPDTGGEKLLKEAKEAYDNLDYDAAATKYQAALDDLTQHPAVANSKQLGEAHFFVAVIALQNGGKSQAKKAQEEFARALVNDADLSVDAKTYGADVKKVFDKAKADVSGRPGGALTVETTPGGAEASLGGKNLGLTPLSDAPTLPTGRHLVTVTRSGYEPSGAFADVTREGTTASIKLKPTQNYGEVRTVAADLVTSGVGSGKVPSGARRLGELMKSRFLVVANVTDGSGALEIWDVETGSQVAGLKVSDDASLTAAASKVKQFMANPSPIKATKVAATEPGEEEPGVSEPVFKKWWFWTAVGVVVVGGATAGTIAAVSGSQGRPFNVVLGTP